MKSGSREFFGNDARHGRGSPAPEHRRLVRHAGRDSASSRARGRSSSISAPPPPYQHSRHGPVRIRKAQALPTVPARKMGAIDSACAWDSSTPRPRRMEASPRFVSYIQALSQPMRLRMISASIQRARAHLRRSPCSRAGGCRIRPVTHTHAQHRSQRYRSGVAREKGCYAAITLLHAPSRHGDATLRTGTGRRCANGHDQGHARVRSIWSSAETNQGREHRRRVDSGLRLSLPPRLTSPSQYLAIRPRI